ncbi:hypothetical protein LBMAG21_16580 [Armatimonadota bacterium]|nr:hypothetical protein LBMAG21_16580 [Armatimonadota bacterium]
MGMTRETKQPGQGRALTFQESELKICDLCGCLNLNTNTDCFICGWHGHFVQETRVVHAALELATRRYGRLELHHLTDARTYREPAPPTWQARLKSWCLGILKRKRQ